MRIKPFIKTVILGASVLTGFRAHSEVILQYFQMPWRSMTQKMPELAEAGYTALWLPPPTKASGGLSVGYDLWDPFDLGNKDQRGGVRTFYGTKEELLEMMETAHRFGIRVYFDNIMNHRAFDVPGFNESTPIDIYPGMRPEDFHLRVTEDGFYRKWDNTRNWNDEWQVLHLGLSDLIDIAHEAGMGGWNHNFGPTEGSHHPGISFVRHPENPEYYDYAPNGDFVGFGNVTQEMLDDNPGAYTENVNAYLMRAVRWKMAVTRADGLRLDAVKHVPAMFFGAMPNEDQFVGYTGNIQLSFMRTRGFDPGSNPRESLFDINKPRNSAMIFGEHLGTPPAFEPYIDRGMRLKDAPLRDSLNGFLGQPWGNLSGMDQPGFSGHPAFNQFTGVSFPHSHDSDFASARELQYAYIMTREGLPIVYTDGYFKAGTLQDSGGAFPRHANTNFLGQFDDPRLPNLAYIREHFARGGQTPHWSDNDVVAYSRIDKRDSGWGQRDISNGDGFTMLFMMNDNYAAGQARAIGPLPIAATPNGPDTWLVNYSTYGGPFGVWASAIATGQVIIPEGGYFIFSFRTPEGSALWGGNELRIYQDGEEPDTVRVTRRDGPNGDASFNPYGLPNRGFPDADTPEPFRYQMTIPRITSGQNLRFVARANGLTENVMMKLNGGIDLNSQMGSEFQNHDPADPGKRDHPPGASNDTFLGWEQARFVHRQHAEKFAAADSARNQIGSAGAETYHWNGGTDFTIVQGPDGANTFDTAGGTRASFIYHNPTDDVGGNDPGHPGEDDNQFEAGAEAITLWAKTNSVGGGFRMVVYYTMDGTNPEGAGGEGLGTTRAVAMNYSHDESGDDWWGTATLPLPESGEQLRYKIGIFRDQTEGSPVASNFPTDPETIGFSQSMMTVFEVDGFDATAIEYFPHNDWATDTLREGLQEGMNFIQARAFLNRSNGAALYNTFKQTFYLDLERPAGEVVFPAENDTLPSQEYGVVVRTDRTVTQVWFNVEDSDPLNDDSVTEIDNGNNAWIRASEVTPSLDVNSEFSREWRFTYRNIPSSGSATIRVRLLELSSSDDFTLSDEDGHFTTLERVVTTAAPEQRLFVAWPQQDGDTVGEGYDMKAYFSKVLTDGLSEAQLIDRFTIRLNNRAQSKEAYRIVWNETDDYHALAFELPLLFNGDPDYLHQIEVVHEVPGGIRLEAFRQVKAFPVGLPPEITIVNPEQFDSNGRQTTIVLPDVAVPTPDDREVEILVSADPGVTAVTLLFEDLMGGTVVPAGGNPQEMDTENRWRFTWTLAQPGTYVFRAVGTVPGEPDVVDFRSIPVIFRQIVEVDPDNPSLDTDNDGIPDQMEIERQIPDTNEEFWTQGQMHLYLITGRTDPLMPITDGGGLPDGLQLGLRGPVLPGETDFAADTNGDGFRNFIPDLDPPIFNTTDQNGLHPRYNFNRSRRDQLGGTMTDPSRADTDNDGLRDSEEDLNRNGRVDIGLLGPDGKVEAILMHPNIPTVYNTSRVDREVLPSNAVFLETDPNSADTIGDGLLDGQADLARNGRVNLYLLYDDGSKMVLDYTDWSHPFHFAYNRMPNANTRDDWEEILFWDNNNRPGFIADNHVYDFAPIVSRAVHWDALFADYNRDGTGNAQTDGWPKLLITETDPLVIDTIGDGLPDGWKVRYGLDPLDDGVYNWRTGDAGNPRNGPDGDLTGDGVTNIQHFLAGTDPRIAVTGVEPPEDSIILGAGPEIGTVNGIRRFEEFMDWTWEDLRALDAFEGGGSNHQGGDIYPAFDGWDSSRDMTAFYVRDGGPSSAGGDDRIYFRVDFHDLQAFAEQGNLDLYVAINFGDTQNPLGERVLPDEVDTLTDMRWRAVVAVYESAAGTVYVDTDPNNNTTTFGQSLTANGVVSRPDYFIGAYFNSELDAVEFAIDRQAVLDAGWLGDPAQLRYQVYTTKSGTQNSPQGPGDIGGRSDIRDSIMNDFIAENHWFAQQGLQGAGSVLNQWIPGDAWAGRVKVALVVHGNQSIRRGQEIQNLINNGQGAGYFRPLDTHEVYGVPLNLHITPTLASAIQWAASEVSWRDGPAFNDRLGGLIRDGIVQLFGTTFSDHILAYFDNAYNADNVALAHRVLEGIYDIDMSGIQVFYPPERVLDEGVLQKIRDLGFNFTLVDQMMHIRHWFEREAALGTDGYRINNIHGVGTFALNDRAGNVKFDMHDSGAAMALRRQMNRMARSGTQDQVLVIHSAWEDFLDADNAAAYDALVRWMANRPWVEIVTLEDIAAGEVDLSRDGQGDAWWQIDRGAPALDKIAQEWIHFASRENYDNWYVGENGFRQGLDGFRFQRRPGEDVEMDYGMQVANTGIAGAAWNAVNGIQNEDLRLLASGVLHASTFITAFHDQPTVDLRKFSDGSYIFPDGGFRELAAFARHNQAQTRRAAIYARVDQWATNPPSSTQTSAENIDLDGEDEYLIYNNRLFAVLERTGGRMIAAWMRHSESGRVFQVVGNLMSYAGSDTEEIGTFHAGAHRTSALTDWWAGTSEYVNDVYTFAPAPNGWTATSSDGYIVKTVTLADDADAFEVSYTVDPLLNDGRLFVRHGLSPDLFSLLIHGQNRLSSEEHDAGLMTLRQGLANDFQVVSRIDTSDPNVSFQTSATDVPDGGSFTTVNMRNQAQTHQVELEGQEMFGFTMSFSLETGPWFDSDGDGLPDWWEEEYFGGPTAANPNALAANHVNTVMQAFIAGLNPMDENARFVAPMPEPHTGGTRNGMLLRLPFAIQGRRYTIWYTDDLMDPEWFIAAAIEAADPPESTEWVDEGDQNRDNPLDVGRRFYAIDVELVPPE